MTLPKDPTKHEEYLTNASKRMQGKGNSMYGKTGSNCPSSRRIGNKHPLWGKSRTYEERLKLVESGIGGFWYGNVRYYGDRTYYCALWNPNLWARIDAAQNYQSIISGKTKENNVGKDGKPRALARHHIYWQPKACCEWDGDIGGYYAWINIGTPKNPNWYKHYIEGDPNKFVLLTLEEHGMISKNKLKWIRIFEELIQEKLNGKCYLTKEEMLKKEKL